MIGVVVGDWMTVPSRIADAGATGRPSSQWRSRPVRLRVLGAGLMATLTLLLVVNVSVALAATASISGTTLTYVASPGEANVATISLDAGTYDIKDSGATITASFGCTSV